MAAWATASSAPGAASREPAAVAADSPAGPADSSARPSPPPLPGDQPPRLITGYRPQYPPEYAAQQVEGEVLVDFFVNPYGKVEHARVVREADPRLSAYAEAAVSLWLFSPGLKNGHPVATHMQVPVVFQANPARKTAQADPAAEAFASHLAAGAAALEKGACDAAVSEFGEAIRINPDAAAGYGGRARAFARLGRKDEALGDFSEAALLDPAAQPALDAYRKSLPDTPERTWASLRYQTFMTVWRTVYETYFDPTFGGVNWLAVREKYRLRLDGTPDKARLLALLQEMLGELRRTHFALVPREAAVFNPSERTRIGTIGAEVAFAEGGVVVTDVRPGSPASAAGLHPGDQIARVDTVSIAPTLAMLDKAGLSPNRSALYVTGFVESRLSSAVGTAIRLDVVSPEPAAAPRTVTVTCAANDTQWSEPIGYFPSTPIRCEARRGADGIALLQFNIFVPPVMKKVKALLRELKPGDGLIIDLRGNGGGISTMASGISGWLCRDEFVIGSMHQRQGVVDLDAYPQASIFDGPVAILIDGRSASTSEIMAAGLGEHHRARLFGEMSAGAALPSVFKSLPTGDLFQFAIADVKTPGGALLEGNGVTPDEVVLRTRADLAAGRDPVIGAARTWIDAQRRRMGAPKESRGSRGP